MFHPQLEELEPRQLLSGTGFFPQRPPLPPHQAGTIADHGGGHGFAADTRAGPGAHGGLGALAGHGTVGDRGGPGFGPYRAIGPGRLDSASTEVLAPPARAPQIATGAPAEARAPNNTTVRTEQRATGPAAVKVSQPAATAPEMTESSSEGQESRTAVVNAVAGEAGTVTPSERPSIPLPVRPQELVAAVSLRVGGPTLIASRSILPSLEEGSRVVPVPSATTQRARLAAGSFDTGSSSPAQAVEAVRDILVLPSPLVSGVLSVLPPFNLPALELGMKLFLDQLEQMEQRLADLPAEHGFCLWIVAGAAAATACEIARRQWRQSPDVPLPLYFSAR